MQNGGLSRDGRTIVYHLRPGVHWSDGVPVSARDVLFSLHAIVDPRNPVASREGYELIDRADALGPLTVRVHLRRAWAPAVATLFTYGTAPQYVLPAHVLAKQQPLARAPFGAAPSVGDGPFSFVSWRRGERLVYRANPRYWRGRPALEQLEIGIVPDPSTNLTLLQSGAIDFNLVAPAQLGALAHVPGLNYVQVPIALVAGLALNLEHPHCSTMPACGARGCKRSSATRSAARSRWANIRAPTRIVPVSRGRTMRESRSPPTIRRPPTPHSTGRAGLAGRTGCASAAEKRWR